MSTQLPSRQEAEDLLYKEAALLDEWRLDEWLELLTEDATYEIPPTMFPKATREIRCSLSRTMRCGFDRA